MLINTRMIFCPNLCCNSLLLPPLFSSPVFSVRLFCLSVSLTFLRRVLPIFLPRRVRLSYDRSRIPGYPVEVRQSNQIHGVEPERASSVVQGSFRLSSLLPHQRHGVFFYFIIDALFFTVLRFLPCSWTMCSRFRFRSGSWG